MATRRIARLNEQLKREISGILREDVRDPRVGTPVVTGVEVTPDLWVARVYVSVEGDESRQAEALDGLEAAAPYVRRELGKELHIRRIPELRFHIDRSLEQAHRIEEILKDVLPPEGEEQDETGAADDASRGSPPEEGRD